MKKGDKIRFNGYQGPGTYNYHNTTVGKLYEIEIVDIYPSGVKAYIYRGDNGKQYIWRSYRENLKNDFTLVQAEQNVAPAERDLNTLQEGDIIKFMGAPNDGNRNRRYRGTTVGKEYMIYRVVYNSDGSVARVRYLDDNGAATSWYLNRYTDMYHFKVMTEQRLYKDDVLATAPTLQDLKTTLDMALLLNDIEWAQETYEQIQQMEGEHA